jgi:hypothetical protein
MGENMAMEVCMNALTRRGSQSLFDEFFRDFAPAFFVQPLQWRGTWTWTATWSA